MKQRRMKIILIILCLCIVGVMNQESGDNSDKQEDTQEFYPHSTADHEATFLSADDSKAFDQLTPEESKQKLSAIVDKVDTNSDGFVTREELKNWIQYTQKKYIRDNIEKMWKTYNPNNDENISWDKYSNDVYQFLNDPASKAEIDFESYKLLFSRDQRRWSAADVDGDGALNKQEFTAFQHPEEFEHMKDLILIESIEEIDKDKDGKISLSEYIGETHNIDGDEEEDEPEWIKADKEHFAKYRDKDGDGFMTGDEIKNWILPDNFDHADAEARHLIYESDKDADDKLTKDEILAKYDIFIGSQVTDFGHLLHDEL